MTVAELIAKLSELDPDLPVGIMDSEVGTVDYNPLVRVEHDEILIV